MYVYIERNIDDRKYVKLFTNSKGPCKCQLLLLLHIILCYYILRILVIRLSKWMEYFGHSYSLFLLIRCMIILDFSFLLSKGEQNKDISSSSPFPSSRKTLIPASRGCRMLGLEDTLLSKKRFLYVCPPKRGILG